MKNIIKKKQNFLTQTEILRKLEKSAINSGEEYQLIIDNLQTQNARLVQDRTQLSEKVKQLIWKQKQLQKQQQIKIKIDPSVHYKKIKRQLEKSYKQLEVYQKKCYNSMNKNALNVQLRDLINKFLCTDQQIKKQRLALIDQKNQFKNLQKGIKKQLKYLNKNSHHSQQLQNDNKQLKKKINNVRIVEDLTEHIEIRVQDSVIGLREKGKFFQKLNTLTVEQIKRQKIKSKMQIINEDSRIKSAYRLKTQSIIPQRYQTLQQSNLKPKLKKYTNKKHPNNTADDNINNNIMEMKQDKLEEIKKQKYQLEQQLNNIQIQFNQLSIVYSEIKSTLYKQQQRKYIKEQQLKNKQEILMCDVNLQVNTQFQDIDPLRIDAIGILEQEINTNTIGTNMNVKQGQFCQHYLINDRLMLKQIKNVQITGLMTHQNKFGLVSIRASYSNNKITPSYSSIPDKYLKQKCKMRKIILSDIKDYLHWFKIYYNRKDDRVVRIEVFSQNKIKFQAGKSRDQVAYDSDNITPFKIDNIGKEIPVCLRTTYKQINHKGEYNKDYVLAGIGFEINIRQ